MLERRAGRLLLCVAVSASLSLLGACGGDDEEALPTSTPGAGPASTGRPQAGADAGADAFDPVDDDGGGTIGPIGLAAISADAFEHLAALRTDERAYRETSFDRTGGNNDFSRAGNFLYADARGDKVLLDAQGPGCVYRIWFTGFDPDQHIRIYFDGEGTPRVDATLPDFFSGKTAPFLAPLVGNGEVSSGGYYSYLPLPFSHAVKITASGGGRDFYYQVDYRLYDPGTAVTTWTGKEDSQMARDLWTHAGADPKSTAGVTATETTVSIAPGASTTLLDVDGPRELTALRLLVPGVAPLHEVTLTDDGRAHQGSSTFHVKVDPKNEGVVLQRRLDYGVADQKAQVFVDGQLAGTWFDRGSDGQARFRDFSFAVPAALTQGKSSVMIKVMFVSGSSDFNEFYWRVFSRVGGAEVETDQLDVGNAGDEAAHQYAIENQTFSGSRTFGYPASSAMAGPLDDLWVRITWDGASKAAVEAPVGALFAQGHFGPGLVKGLAVGMNDDGVLYSFFPMPFAKHAKVELVNKGQSALDGVWAEIRSRPFASTFANVGNFAVAYNEATPSTAGKDLLFLDTTGAGQIVGVVLSEQGPTFRGYLEGDDRVSIDDRRTPSIHGTGTEDEFTGGFYFDHGPYSLPVNGNPTHVVTSTVDGTAAYRLFLPDVVPFRSHARLTMEHGPVDDIQSDAWTLAYYYVKPDARLTLTDTLTLGDAKSESDHGYTATGKTFDGEQTFTFEGEDDAKQVTASGHAHKGTSELDLAVSPKNRGVVLRRLLDQNVGRQAARVSVDGVAVGTWSTPQKNTSHGWREDEIDLPSGVTSGKSRIHVKIEFVSSDNDWNEFEYRALSVSD